MSPTRSTLKGPDAAIHHDRPDTFRHPFSNYIEHSRSDPYAFDASRYGRFIAISISNFRDLPILMRYFQLRKPFDSEVSEDSPSHAVGMGFDENV